MCKNVKCLPITDILGSVTKTGQKMPILVIFLIMSLIGEMFILYPGNPIFYYMDQSKRDNEQKLIIVVYIQNIYKNLFARG